MINIVHVNIHCDDQRKITAVELKLKSLTKEGETDMVGHTLVATVSAAFFKTTLLTDAGKSLETAINPKRNNIVNMTIRIANDNLTLADVGRFADAFQEALDNTKLF